MSTSTGLGPDGNGSGGDVFLIDRQTSVTTRVTGANGPSDAPSVADDGSVVFRSAATDLAGPDTNGHLDAFRWVTGTVTRITDSPGDITPPLSVAPHAIADDGDVVFAETTYSYDDGSGVIIFTGGVARRWDAQSATVSTLGLTGAPAGPVISRNGHHVVYSDVTGVVVDQDAGAAIVPGDPEPAMPDVYLWDRGS